MNTQVAKSRFTSVLTGKVARGAPALGAVALGAFAIGALTLGAFSLGVTPSSAASLAPESQKATEDTGAPPIRLVYEFYAAGLHLATVETNAVLANGQYEISTKGQSSGIADSLLRARFESSATGTLGIDGPRPHTFRNFSDTRFGVRQLEMTRATDGTFDVTAEPELEPQQAAALRSGLADGTIDPLTASLYSALRPSATACTEKMRVFDGRRVFTLAFSRTGTEALPAGGQSVFDGDAIKCHLKYVPLAGQSREWKLEQARNPSPPVEIWMAPFARSPGSSTPQAATKVSTKSILLPVRLRLKSEWGTALAHLTAVKFGEETMTQASLKHQSSAN